MAEKVLEGFLIRGMTELPDIEMIINEMRVAVKDRANIAFKKLVEWQTERLVDEIALNQIRRPEQQSIIEMAVSIVRSRMFYAEKTMQKTEFNLSCGLQVFTSTLGNKPVVYMKIFAPNNIYSRSFSRIKELEPFDINTDDINNKGKQKEMLYSSLLGKYGGIDALTTPLLSYDSLIFKYENLSFRPVGDRAAELAQEKVLNHLVSCYACDNEIQPHKLMEYTVFAFRRLKEKDIETAVRFEKEQLEKILPEITLDLVVKTGRMDQVQCPDTSEKECQENDEAEETGSETEEIISEASSKEKMVLEADADAKNSE